MNVRAIGLLLNLLVLSALPAVAQAPSSEANARCNTGKGASQPIYVPPDDGMQLYLSALAANPEDGITEGRVANVMRRSGIKSAWARVQVLVDRDGRVQGAQNIDGTPDVLAPVLREVQRYRFKPYIVDGCAVAFVTVLKLTYRIEEPACSLTNVAGCR